MPPSTPFSVFRKGEHVLVNEREAVIQSVDGEYLEIRYTGSPNSRVDFCVHRSEAVRKETDDRKMPAKSAPPLPLASQNPAATANSVATDSAPAATRAPIAAIKPGPFHSLFHTPQQPNTSPPQICHTSYRPGDTVLVMGRKAIVRSVQDENLKVSFLEDGGRGLAMVRQSQVQSIPALRDDVVEDDPQAAMSSAKTASPTPTELPVGRDKRSEQRRTPATEPTKVLFKNKRTSKRWTLTSPWKSANQANQLSEKNCSPKASDSPTFVSQVDELLSGKATSSSALCDLVNRGVAPDLNVTAQEATASPKVTPEDDSTLEPSQKPSRRRPARKGELHNNLSESDSVATNSSLGSEHARKAGATHASDESFVKGTSCDSSNASSDSDDGRRKPQKRACSLSTSSSEDNNGNCNNLDSPMVSAASAGGYIFRKNDVVFAKDGNKGLEYDAVVLEDVPNDNNTGSVLIRWQTLKKQERVPIGNLTKLKDQRIKRTPQKPDRRADCLTKSPDQKTKRSSKKSDLCADVASIPIQSPLTSGFDLPDDPSDCLSGSEVPHRKSSKRQTTTPSEHTQVSNPPTDIQQHDGGLKFHKNEVVFVKDGIQCVMYDAVVLEDADSDSSEVWIRWGTSMGRERVPICNVVKMRAQRSKRNRQTTDRWTPDVVLPHSKGDHDDPDAVVSQDQSDSGRSSPSRSRSSQRVQKKRTKRSMPKSSSENSSGSFKHSKSQKKSPQPVDGFIFRKDEVVIVKTGKGILSNAVVLEDVSARDESDSILIRWETSKQRDLVPISHLMKISHEKSQQARRSTNQRKVVTPKKTTAIEGSDAESSQHTRRSTNQRTVATPKRIPARPLSDESDAESADDQSDVSTSSSTVSLESLRKRFSGRHSDSTSRPEALSSSLKNSNTPPTNIGQSVGGLSFVKDEIVFVKDGSKGTMYDATVLEDADCDSNSVWIRWGTSKRREQVPYSNVSKMLGGPTQRARQITNRLTIVKPEIKRRKKVTVKRTTRPKKVKSSVGRRQPKS